MRQERIPENSRAVTRADRHRALTALRRQLAAVVRDQHHAASCRDARLKGLLRRHQQQLIQRMAEFRQWLEASETNSASETTPDRSQEREAAPPMPESPATVYSAHDTDATRVRPARDTGSAQLQVVARQDVGEHGLIFKLERPPQFTFQPGQYVRLELDGIRRNYSIVSAPHEPFLEFFADLVPGGRMSGRLRTLRIGESVTLASGARGRLTMDRSFPEQVMVATETGIAPFVSMLRAFVAGAEEQHRFHVFHGVSYLDEFGYYDELERMAMAHPQQLTYLPTVSRPEDQRNAAWSGATGRVHTLLGPFFQQNFLGPEATVIYACGNTGMIRAVREQFSSRAFTIRTERFW